MNILKSNILFALCRAVNRYDKNNMNRCSKFLLNSHGHCCNMRVVKTVFCINPELMLLHIFGFPRE